MKKQQQDKSNGFKAISKEELDQVNSQIVPRFGARQKIISGSYEMTSTKGKVYYISLGLGCSYQPSAELEKIGSVAKDVWGAKEIYCRGNRIA